jgi:Eukaryotic initiation factor 4E
VFANRSRLAGFPVKCDARGFDGRRYTRWLPYRSWRCPRLSFHLHISEMTSITTRPIVEKRPSLPRRSSSLHKAVIARLRPLPFQYIWSAWHGKPADSSYSLNQLVEEVPDIAFFYRIFNNVPWESVKAKESIHFFRAGVKPLWEDPENVDGGCLVIKVRKGDSKAIRAWEEICLMCCGGQVQAAVTKGVYVDAGLIKLTIAERDHVLGMSYSPRLYWVHISIWTKQGGNQKSVELLTESILSGLSPDLRPKSNADYYFKKHSDHEGWSEVVKT